ncbi:MAG: NACHT domain-containing protein [Actinophytocola sp.]|uniref:NACHT domain-containing protein n=1 Tax=Actinophytocola sp. TaxID=1872138 RepID=UPI003D6C1A80
MIEAGFIGPALTAGLNKSLTAALSQVAKRLWLNGLSPSAKRNRIARSSLQKLADHDLIEQLRLDVLVNSVPAGLSVAHVEVRLGGPVYQGLIHELIAVRLLKMPDTYAEQVLENMQIATRLEFSNVGASEGALADFGSVLFAELDRAVGKLVRDVDGIQARELAELRESATVQLINGFSDGIVRHNKNLRKQGNLKAAMVAREWERAYRTQVARAHGFIEPPDFERKRKFPIDRLFVSPQIMPRDETSIQYTVWDLFDIVDRSVLLGDPGGGKSTASDVLAWNAAREDNEVIPFVVILRTYIDDNQSIVEHIERRLSSHYQCPAPTGTVEALLLSGKAIVIFDGLDELLVTSRRRLVTDRVELFGARYPLTRMLVTSRRIGYEEAAMDPAMFEIYELSEFSDENVSRYVHQWFSVVDGATEEDAHARSDSFIDESAATPDLRRNPLMLALMCIIYRGQNWIPRNRPEMYEHCAQLLFDKWDSSRSIFVELRAGAHVDSAVKHLAYWMFTGPGTQGVTETALVREAAEFLQAATNESPAETKRAATQFIEFCRTRAWVLVEVGSTADGEGLFGFKHRTFMEYFAAYELTRIYDGPERIARAILPQVAAVEWETVTELAVQISNKHSKDGASRIIKALLADKRYSSGTSRLNISKFALRCMGFVPVPLSLAEEIAESLVDALVKMTTDMKELLPISISVIPALQASIEESIVNSLRVRIADEREPEREIATEIALDLPDFFSSDDDSITRWSAWQAQLFSALESEILTNRLSANWFNAWRGGLITFEKFMIEAPTFPHLPLQALFESHSWRYLQGGWTAWGAFIPEKLLQFHADADDGFPINGVELEWLDEYLAALELPPWVDHSNDTNFPTTYLESGFNGAFLGDKLQTSIGSAIFVLMLVSIELGRFSDEYLELASPFSYDAAYRAIKDTRIEGVPLPSWVADYVARIPANRKMVVRKWLNGDMTFSVNIVSVDRQYLRSNSARSRRTAGGAQGVRRR